MLQLGEVKVRQHGLVGDTVGGGGVRVSVKATVRG